jgi:hypothetical protein
MKNTLYCTLAIILLVTLSISCKQKQKPTPPPPKKEVPKIAIPEFNADSAYHFIEKQVAFGPRVPNTAAHSQGAAWLSDKLGSYADDLIVQNAKVRAYNGTILNIKNIIGVFNPEVRARILLAAHWDSRPYADHDQDESLHRTPIDGANDGASGVGVLLEIARLMKDNPPLVGVDIIFFDAEDYGPPEDDQSAQDNDAWALGSQYWARNPHTVGYTARFGIVLDMVGAEGARFPMEGYSKYYAPDIVKKVWNKGHSLGYQDFFLFEEGGFINDDHLAPNQVRRIPTIDIIHLDRASVNGSFFDHWHTINDNMDNIDRHTLKVVGRTVTKVIYDER